MSFQTIKKQIPAKVNLLAVSKLQSIEKIKNLYSESVRDFGENYVQELKEKQEALSDLEIRWHLIGHLQKNKVKMVVGKCFLIHSVDSLQLAEEINKRAINANLKQKILLQVNVSEENSKEGMDPKNLSQSFSEFLKLSNLEILGLMTMPPFVDKPEDNRLYFKRLKEILNQLKSENDLPSSFAELSMGTSQDYQVAIEEGATWIRLGSTLFGARS